MAEKLNWDEKVVNGGKTAQGRFSASEANELRDNFNTNADELDTVQQQANDINERVIQVESDITSLQEVTTTQNEDITDIKQEQITQNEAIDTKASTQYVNDEINGVIDYVNQGDEINANAITTEITNRIAADALKANTADILSNINIVFSDLTNSTTYTNLSLANKTDVPITYKNPTTATAGFLTFNSSGVATLPFTAVAGFVATIFGVTGVLSNYTTKAEFNTVIGLPVLVDYPLDFTGLANVSGAGNTFFNYTVCKVLTPGKLVEFTTKTNTSNITPVCYNILGSSGSFTYQLLHTFALYAVVGTDPFTKVITDDFVCPANSYIGFLSSGNVFSGARAGISYTRLGQASLAVNMAIAYSFKLDVNLTTGVYQRLNALEVNLDTPIPSINLFDENNIIPNSLINTTGVISSNNGFYVTNKMKVKGGFPHAISKPVGRQFTYYNEADQVIAGGSDLQGITTFTPPALAAYMRLTMPVDTPHMQLQQAGAPTGYFPFGTTTARAVAEANKLSLANKLWIGYGDSIDQQQRWQFKVLNRIPMRFLSYGIGGTTLVGGTGTSMSSPTRLATLPIADLYTINGGMNDWRNNLAIGVLGDTTASTMYGALYVILNALITLNPLAKIVFNTIPFAMRSAGTILNAGGKSAKDYSDVIINFCKRYNIPYADVNTLCGWNELNITSYVDTEPGTGEMIHPNTTTGGQSMANIVANTFFKISN